MINYTQSRFHRDTGTTVVFFVDLFFKKPLFIPDFLLIFPFREFLRLGNPLNCGAWDKKLLKNYRVHKPSSLSYDAEMRSKMITFMKGTVPEILLQVFFVTDVKPNTGEAQ